MTASIAQFNSTQDSYEASGSALIFFFNDFHADLLKHVNILQEGMEGILGSTFLDVMDNFAFNVLSSTSNFTAGNVIRAFGKDNNYSSAPSRFQCMKNRNFIVLIAKHLKTCDST